jgi:uncharacterized membrane protein required for colicin V production
MSWIDFVGIGVILVVVLIITLRGREYMGAALFDTTAVVGATAAAHHVYRRLADVVRIAPWVAYVGLFVVVGVVLILVAAKLHSLTQISFQPFNVFISFFLGIVSGWAVCYMLYETIAAASDMRSATAKAMQASPVAAEILEFRTLTGTRAFMDTVRFIKPEPWEQPERPKRP